MNRAFDEMFAELTSAGVPPEVVARLAAEFRQCNAAILNEQFSAGTWWRLEEQNFVDFLDGLLNRQDPKLPNFDELYRRKAELERNLTDDDTP